VIPAHHRRGSGETLVCHPGGPGTSSRSFGELAGLDDSLALVLVDPRGTGDTPRPDDPAAYATEDYVADLEELREELGLERMNLLGWSHGGVVAMAYAATHPARVAKLVLYATLARFQAEQEGAMTAAMDLRRDEPWYADAVEALEAEQAGAFADDAELARLVQREMPFYFTRYDDTARAFLDDIHEPYNADALRTFNTTIFPTFDHRGDLPRIEASTLVLVGADDFLCGPAAGDEIAALVPDARTVTVPGVGHFVHVEAPEAFREEVLSFLQT
jgi:pimeloyl-ACP methyl ester carboxylesterase